MAEFLLSPALRAVLLTGAVFFGLLTPRRPKHPWTILSALCTIAACLLGLAAGRSLEQLLTAVLIPTAVILLTNQEGGGGT